MKEFTIKPLSNAIGAEIIGVDLSLPQDPDTMRTINQAWLDYQVILFRDQNISLEDQRRFAEWFGELGNRRRGARKDRPTEEEEQGPNVMLVTNVRDKEGKPIGSLPDGEMMFHSDTPYFEHPDKATILYALEIPSWGGHTKFSNSYKAAETLPKEIKDKIRGKIGLQAYAYGTVTKQAADRYDKGESPFWKHPILRKNPDTGRTALFVSELMTEEIIGLPADESAELLDFLFQHQRKPDFVYEHVWRVGDLLMWDNRCSVHARTDFPSDERRMLRRLTIQDFTGVQAGDLQ